MPIACKQCPSLFPGGTNFACRFPVSMKIENTYEYIKKISVAKLIKTKNNQKLKGFSSLRLQRRQPLAIGPLCSLPLSVLSGVHLWQGVHRVDGHSALCRHR